MFRIFVLIVFNNEPQTVGVAKAVGIKLGNPVRVDATDVDVAVVAIDDNNFSVISATLICKYNFYIYLTSYYSY